MLFHNFYDMIPLGFKYMFNHHERMNGKSRHNRNFDYFHPSTHTYAKVTIHTHSIYRCIGTLCHSRAISVVSLFHWNLDYCARGCLIYAFVLFIPYIVIGVNKLTASSNRTKAIMDFCQRQQR